jgi:hypothetical protein
MHIFLCIDAKISFYEELCSSRVRPCGFRLGQGTSPCHGRQAGVSKKELYVFHAHRFVYTQLF